MFKFDRRWMQRLSAVCVAAAAALFAGAATAAVYVDKGLPDLTPEQRVSVAQPLATQLVFEFQTKGVANQRATTETKKWVVETAQASGLFSEVSEAAQPTGGLLTVTINNVPQADAAAKGFVTGLTFGLKGSTVVDNYECTFEYTPAPGAPKQSKSLTHAIYFTVGATGAPENGVKMKNIPEAVETMVRQAVSHGLNGLAAPAAAPQVMAPAVEAASPPQPTTAPGASQ